MEIRLDDDKPSNIVTLATTTDIEKRRRTLKVTEVTEDLNNLSVVLKDKKLHLSSLIAQQRAVNLSPESGFLWNGLGSVLWNCGRYDEALAAINKAIELLGDDPSPYGNLGMVLCSMNRKEEGLAALKKAWDLCPPEAQSAHHLHWNYAMALLDQDEWEHAFKEYDCRVDFHGRKLYPKMPFPMWDGEDINDKTLFIQAEQGNGDRILFSRYLAWLREKWPHARILYLCSSPDLPPLESLLWCFHTDLGIEFLPPGTPWPKADYGIFMMSLARIHGTSWSNRPSDPGLIRKRCQQLAGSVNLPEPLTPAIKVGICWSGNPEMNRNAERSIPFELMFDLETIPNVQLYSLQFGSNDLTRFDARQLVFDCAQQIEANKGLGFVGTGATMLGLDLMITCCTANAHLAGALDVPCWTVLCEDCWWVWGREGNTTAWYPNMRLFRQDRQHDWKPVMKQVRAELIKYADETLAKRKSAAA